MTRETSIDAYNYIKESGLLSKRRWQVYDVLYQHGPLTSGEVWHRFFKDQNISQNSINPRFSELQEMDIVTELPNKRICSVTNMTCIAWDVTSKYPKPLPKTKPKIQQVIEKEVGEEREACAQIAESSTLAGFEIAQIIRARSDT